MKAEGTNNIDNNEGDIRLNFAWAALAAVPQSFDPPIRCKQWEDAKEAAVSGIQRLLDVDRSHVYLSFNTSSAVQRVLSRLGQLLGEHTAGLFLSDMEYPGILATADESWRGPMYIAQVERYVWRGQAHAVAESLQRAVLLTRPSVVYLSHVSRSTGYVLPLSVVKFIRQVLPSAVIVLDGAQALGNIHVGTEILDNVDFYVGCGHKWLMGRTTVGLTIAEPRWDLADPAQGLSRQHGLAGTSDASPLYTLARGVDEIQRSGDQEFGTNSSKACAEHGCELAELFANKLLEAINIRAIGLVNSRWRWNGIVTVPWCQEYMCPGARAMPFSTDLSTELPKQPRISVVADEEWRGDEGADSAGPRYLVHSLPGKEPRIERLDYLRRFRSGGPQGPALRACFHGAVHETEDVEKLIKALSDAHDCAQGS